MDTTNMEQKKFVNLSLTLMKALVMKNATSALQIASKCWNKRNILILNVVESHRERDRQETCNQKRKHISHENK